MAAVESHADTQTGLTNDEAHRSLDRFGPNVLPEAKRGTHMSVFVGQFKSPLSYHPRRAASGPEDSVPELVASGVAGSRATDRRARWHTPAQAR